MADLNEGERALLRRAYDAIGQHGGDDYRLDPAAHVALLSANSPRPSELIAILAHDPVVKAYGERFKEYDRLADRARARFESWTFRLTVVVTAAMLFGAFLLATPPELDWIVRAGLASVVGLVTAALVAPPGSRCEKKLNTLVKSPSATVLAYVAMTAVVTIPLIAGSIIPKTLEPIILYLKLGTLALVVVALLLADFLSGGPSWGLLAWSSRKLAVMCAWIHFYRATRWLKAFGARGSLLQEWHRARGEAEALRRTYFVGVMNAMPIQATPPDAPARDVPLLLQKLEYFRRFQICVQMAYYRRRGEANRTGADRVPWLQRLLLLALVAAGLTYAATGIGSLVEQGPSAGPLAALASQVHPPVTDKLLQLLEVGADDLALLLTLTALGAYVVALLVSTLLRQQRTAVQFRNALADLVAVTARHPENLETLSHAEPLTEARVLASKPDASGAEQQSRILTFVQSVNRGLAAEVMTWSDQTVAPFVITMTDKRTPRLTAADQLLSEHFDRICAYLRDYGIGPIRARRVGFVAARQAKVTETIDTISNGLESQITAKPGDWVVTNMDRSKAIIRDRDGAKNIYVIDAKSFADRYESTQDAPLEEGQIHSAKSVVDALWIAGGFTIVPPWGGTQQIEAGYLVRNPSQTLASAVAAVGYETEVYGVHEQPFLETYEILTD